MEKAKVVAGVLEEVRSCRAKDGGCQFALASLRELKKLVEKTISDSGWEAFLKERFPDRILPHQRLSIALAACPNACTQPQIKDLGIVAALRPTGVGMDCNGCGECEEICAEKAILLRAGRAHLLAERCLGCGLCIESCPHNAIDTEGLRFRILIGGKLGRHPAWARELRHGISLEDVPGVLSETLSWIMTNLGPGERVADVVDRRGVP